MEHPQGVLSHREQGKVGNPERGSMGTAPKRMLMTTMASTLGETLRSVRGTLEGGVTAAAVGIVAMGGVGHDIAGDEGLEDVMTDPFREIDTLAELTFLEEVLSAEEASNGDACGSKAVAAEASDVECRFLPGDR